jgi:hypothetical protein
MQRHKSPCIDICDFSGYEGWCLGCGRTLQESQKWKSMKPYAKKTIEKQLEKRLNQLNQR